MLTPARGNGMGCPDGGAGAPCDGAFEGVMHPIPYHLYRTLESLIT